MAYDDHHVFINGEAFVAGGRDARLVRQLADRQWLGAQDLARLSAPAQALLRTWCEDGWLRPCQIAPQGENAVRLPPRSPAP